MAERTKRTRMVPIRLAPSEQEELVARADREGFADLSTYIRTTMLRLARQDEPPRKTA